MEKLKRKKILVVGGTGFIGSHLVKKCLNLGWSVTSLSLKKKKNRSTFNKVRYIYLDVANIHLLKKKLKFNFDYVVNLGGYINHSSLISKKREILRNHFNSTLNLVEFTTSRIKRYVHIGTSDEYGKNLSPVKENLKPDPQSSYAKAKSKSSNYLLNLYKKKNFPVTILRLFLVYGPGQKQDRLVPYVISNSLSKKPINLSHGNQIRDFCYVDDVINAIVLCLKKKESVGQIFNVGSGTRVSVKEIVNKIIKITRGGLLFFNNARVKKKENLKLYPSVKKINKKLGWKAKVPLNTGLKKTINFYKIKQKNKNGKK